MTRPPPEHTLFPTPSPFRSDVVGDATAVIRHVVGDPVCRHVPVSIAGVPIHVDGGDVLSAAQQEKAEENTDGGLHAAKMRRSEEHTSELQSRQYLVCRLLLE